MTDTRPDDGWKSKMIQPRFLRKGSLLRPAEVSDGLVSAMLARGNILEDANYHKVVPNQYIVELSEEDFARSYQMIEQRIIQQWTDKLLEQLMTANNRLGRREYYFGGRVSIEIRRTPGLKPGQARILCRVQANPLESSRAAVLPACLEMLADRRRWPLHQGVVTIGRDDICDIYLDMPAVQERRLISGQHAYIVCEDGQYRIFDGAPAGKPSMNGTYVNYQRVTPAGYLLQNGDLVLLAALDPLNPRPDLPGSVTLRFFLDCKG